MIKLFRCYVHLIDMIVRRVLTSSFVGECIFILVVEYVSAPGLK